MNYISIKKFINPLEQMKEVEHVTSEFKLVFKGPWTWLGRGESRAEWAPSDGDIDMPG